MVGSRSPLLIYSVAGVLLALAGCGTSANLSYAGPEIAEDPQTGLVQRTSENGSLPTPSVDELNRLLTQATESLSLGNHAEALHNLVSLTVIAPDSDQGRRAATELDRLSSAILLEPTAHWLARDGSQVSASVTILKSTGEPLPSVIATITEGPARVAVHALMIRFTVTEGGVPGRSFLIPTSEFGTATAPIRSEVVGFGEVSVAATPVVVTETGQVALSGEPLVFTYDPPSTVFVALTATIVGDRIESAPDLAKAVAGGLRPIGSVTLQDGSAVNGFLSAYSGDPEAVGNILRAYDAAILGIAVLEVQEISQVVYQGRVYDIWEADGVVRFLLFDPVGGKSLIILSSEPLSGQGGSEQDALVDIERVGAEALELLVPPGAGQIRSIVTGSRE